MHNLLVLAGLSKSKIEELKVKHPRQPNDQARFVAPALNSLQLKKIEKQRRSTRLLIVRHPFERLLSAFRDKLERCYGKEPCTLKTDWYYKKYGRGIVSKYRPAARSRFREEFFSAENNFGSPLPVSGHSWRSDDLPSWWEFVQYVIDGPQNLGYDKNMKIIRAARGYDEHWIPASLYCSVCSFSFNYILHANNINQEETFFIEKIGAKDLIQPRWDNKINDEGLSKGEILYKYFNLLDDDDIRKLYRIYEDDFVLFGFQFKFRGLHFNAPQKH